MWYVCNKRQELQDNPWKWKSMLLPEKGIYGRLFCFSLLCFPTFFIDNQICFCGRSTQAVILYFDSNKRILRNLTFFRIRGSFWVIPQPHRAMCPLFKLRGPSVIICGFKVLSSALVSWGQQTILSPALTSFSWWVSSLILHPSLSRAVSLRPKTFASSLSITLVIIFKLWDNWWLCRSLSTPVEVLAVGFECDSSHATCILQDL